MKWFVLVCVLVGIVTQPSAAGAQACGEVIRSDRVNHNAVLPAGFRNTSWGMSREAVQAVRGRALEEQPDLSNTLVHKLFETMTDEKGVASIHYTFYDDRLMKVVLYLDQEAIEWGESELVAKFQKEFGVQNHHSLEELDDQEKRLGIRNFSDKDWVWCDAFTEQTLRRRPDHGEVLVIRQSQYIYDDLANQVTEDERKATFDAINNLDTK